jgi:hypothetical protein
VELVHVTEHLKTQQILKPSPDPTFASLLKHESHTREGFAGLGDRAALSAFLLLQLWQKTSPQL